LYAFPFWLLCLPVPDVLQQRRVALIIRGKNHYVIFHAWVEINTIIQLIIRESFHITQKKLPENNISSAAEALNYFTTSGMLQIPVLPVEDIPSIITV
jgi:hypothetical protein